MARLKDTRARLWFRALGCLFTAGVGLLLLSVPDTTLENLSYDLPFRLRGDLAVTNVVIVYFNQSALAAAFEPEGMLRPEAFTPPLRTNLPPDRRIYAPLLETLRKDGARVVLFDCDFSQPHPAEDALFAGALRQQSPAVIGGVYDNPIFQQTGDDAGTRGAQLLEPNSALRQAVTNWGILAVDPSPSDHVARRLFTRDGQTNAAIFLAAQLSGFTGDANEERWLNYYGPRSIDSVLLPDALRPENANKFRDRAVFVGGNDPNEPDLHPTPYSRTGSPGVEMLATGYSNLVQSIWLKRLNTGGQAMIVAGWGVFALVIFLCFRTRDMFWLVPAGMALPLAAGCCTQWAAHCWWSWAVCSVVQTPLAACWSALVANRWAPWPPVAFISYRRVEGEGGGYAQAVWSELEHRGYGAICDVKVELTTTAFRPQLLALIDGTPNFILILSRDSLKPERINNEEDVLRAEIRHALSRGKNIIPVMIGDFRMPAPNELPPDIRQLPDNHALTRRDEDPWPVMDAIVANLRQTSVFTRLRRVRGTGESRPG